MSELWFVLSPCGTSLLTNSITDQTERKAIGRCANSKNREECSLEDLRLLDGLIKRMDEQLASTDQAGVARLSAELNAITKLYQGHLNFPQHFHQLLCTDTWLGEATATSIADWLRKIGFTVDIKRQLDLRTDNLQAFQAALSDLVQWCEETVSGYAKNHYRIIFNLTGGFKSVQGFLQTLAMFYADETIYVFEAGEELMRIPRLPIKMNADQVVREHLQTFRRLALGLKVINIDNIPETLLLRITDDVTLSAWGSLIWEQTKKQLYEEKLHRSPSPKLLFGPQYEHSLDGLAPDRLRHVNERLDQLARYLEDNMGRYNPHSLDFKPLQGAGYKGSTHECDAWADLDAKRLFGHFEDGVYVLDRLDKGLH